MGNKHIKLGKHGVIGNRRMEDYRHGCWAIIADSASARSLQNQLDVMFQRHFLNVRAFFEHGCETECHKKDIAAAEGSKVNSRPS